MRRTALALLISGLLIGASTVPGTLQLPGTSTTVAAAPGPGAIEWREVTIPAGTAMAVVLDQSVGSSFSRVEQPVRGHLARNVVVDGVTALPSGSPVTGVVTDARRSGKVKGRAHVSMRFTSLTRRGDSERYRIQTRPIGRLAPATKGEDALKIGIPAGGGAAIGALTGGKKGALIGSAIGGGAGTAVVLSTRGKEVGYSKGSVVTIRLTQPLTVRYRV